MWLNRNVKGGLYFSLLMFLCAEWSAACALESASLTIADKVFWSKVSYLGVVCASPLWFLFSLSYTQVSTAIINKFKYLIWTVPLFILLMTFLNDYHKLIWTDFNLIGNTPELEILYNHGPLFYLNVLYSYTLLGAGFWIFLRYIYKSGSTQKRQIISILIGLSIPWLSNLLYILLSPKSFRGADLTTLAFSITGIILITNILNFKFLSIIPTAKEIVYQHLRKAIVVINNDNIIADFNPAAALILGKDIKIGSQIEQLKSLLPIPFVQLLNDLKKEKIKILHIPKLKKWFEVEYDNLPDSSGSMIYFFDITSLEQNKKLLSSIINFLPDATFVIDKEKKVIIWNKAIEKMTGINAQNIIGKKNYEYSIPFYGKRRPILADAVLEKDYDSPTLKLYTNPKIEGDTISIEIYNKFIKKEGIHIWAIAKPLYDEGGRIAGAIESMRDISALKKIQKDYQDKIKELSDLNNLMINRELKIIELKKQLHQLDINTEDNKSEDKK